MDTTVISLSKGTIAKICDDVGQIYIMTTEKTYSEVVASDEFKRVAKIIRDEVPDVNDYEILKLALKAYSNRIRKE